MKNIKWCDRTLFLCPIYYGVCTSKKTFAAEMRRQKIERPPEWVPAGSHACTHFFYNQEGKTAAIVCFVLDQPLRVVELCGLLVHEAVHIWQEIKKNIGEKEPSSEFEAYAVQWISQQLLEHGFAELAPRKK